MFNYIYKNNPGEGKPLGARLSEDKPYAEKYPLTAETIPSLETPVVIGIPWYTDFDSPQRDTLSLRYWIGRKKDLGWVRGGHAVCLKPYNLNDKFRWWRYYNQGQEGACVGFSLTRAITMMNVETYDARWLYREAQLIDEYEETPPQEGTSIDAGCQILFNVGHKRTQLVSGQWVISPPDLLKGISAYRWATNVEDIHKSLKNPVADKLGAIPILNSWGLDYPHLVWMPDETANRVIFQEYGEAAVLTDR